MIKKTPARQGALWDPNEELRVYRAYADGIAVEKIAHTEQRSAIAILNRLKKLGLMNARGERVSMLPDLKSSFQKHRRQAVSENHQATHSEPEQKVSDPDFGIDVFYQVHGMSKRLYTSLKKMGIRDFRETLRHAPSEYLQSKSFSSRSLQELIRFQQIYLYNPNPIALEKRVAIQEFKMATCNMASRARVLGQTDEVASSELFYYLGKLNAELARIENTADPSPVEELSGQPLWSYLTSEKILGLLQILVQACAPDNNHAQVITARLGLGDELLGLQEVGDILHLSRDRVRWTQERVLNTLLYQLAMQTRSHARLLRQLASRLIACSEGEPAEVVFLFCNEFMEDGSDWMVAALLYVALGYCHNFAQAKKKALYHKKRSEEGVLGHYQTRLKDAAFNGEMENLLRQGAASAGSPSHNLIPHLDGPRQTLSEDSLAREDSFLSRKCNMEITYASLNEYCFYQFLEKCPRVVWYQDRPVSVPYQVEGFMRRYYPSLGLVTHDGKGIVLDILEPLAMVRKLSLVKALRAREYLGGQGVAFNLATQDGQGLADLARNLPDEEAAVAVLSLIDEKGVVSWCDYDRLRARYGIGIPQLIGLIIKHDLCFQKKPFRLSRLERGLSFQPLLDALPKIDTDLSLRRPTGTDSDKGVGPA